MLALAIGATAHAVQEFRSSVALVAVDVQVVDDNGYPVEDLGPADFEVTIAGRRRPVTFVDLIRHSGPVPERLPAAATLDGGALARPAADDAPGRLIVIVVDAGNFDVGSWQRAQAAARTFLGALGANDRVGLYVSPVGPVIEPGPDHGRVSRALSAVTARGRALSTRFNLRPSEAVDITAEGIQQRSGASAVLRTRDILPGPGGDTLTVQDVHVRECPADPECPAWILLEANSAVQELEMRASESILALRRMIAVLATWQGRKTVVLLSGGVVVSDRPGGRPDPPDLSRVLGEAVARANAVIYTLHVAAGPQDGYNATRRVAIRSSADDLRELGMQSAWLERLSDAAGGSLFRVDLDAGTEAWQRILRETSAYYLLGVAPMAEDRDGRLKPLRVRVHRPDTTVRSRAWVVLSES